MRSLFLRLFNILYFLLFGNLITAQELYTIPKGVQSKESSLENINGVKSKGAISNRGAKGNAFTSLGKGDSLELMNVNGAGIIHRMWFTFDDRSPEMLRSLRLRMYWDHQNKPAVDVPFGDFFCIGLGQVMQYENCLFSTAEGRSFNCYIPMPYRSGARITLTNESGKDLSLLFFDIDFIRRPKSKRDELYFHTNWNRQQTAKIGEDVTLFTIAKGKGRFLGVSIGLNVNTIYGNTWWGEGEVKMYIDGDSSHPSIVGTGTEDYIGTGWFMGTFINRYQGCLQADRKAGKYSFYRFHVPDAIYFEKDCRVILQQIGGWYAKDVKELLAKGVPLLPVSLYGKKGFRGLFDTKQPAEELAKADQQDWLNFYRSDDYAVTTYYYLNKP